MVKKILENWKHIEEVEKQIKERTGDPEAGFNATSYFFGGDGRHLMLRAMYRGKKGKKGHETFTQKYNDLLVSAKFCPFTGKALYEESEAFGIEK
jgi:hypothetical protein